MVLHTGEAELRDDGTYRGTSLNRCARLRSIAHGGQIVLSQATYEVIADRPPDSAGLCDLGAGHPTEPPSRPSPGARERIARASERNDGDRCQGMLASCASMPPAVCPPVTVTAVARLRLAASSNHSRARPDPAGGVKRTR